MGLYIEVLLKEALYSRYSTGVYRKGRKAGEALYPT
jgi:hypothetical protein